MLEKVPGHTRRGDNPRRFAMLIAIQIEEQTLVHLHGEQYRSYQRRVPMLLPFGRRSLTRSAARA